MLQKVNRKLGQTIDYLATYSKITFGMSALASIVMIVMLIVKYRINKESK